VLKWRQGRVPENHGRLCHASCWESFFTVLPLRVSRHLLGNERDAHKENV
jgi:hypothetical protein